MSYILSPLLFNIYMKPLGEVIRRCGLRNHQYADDTQLYLSFSTNPGEAVAVLNRCLAEVMGWMRANKLKLNPDKTEVLLVGGSGFGEGELNLVLNGVALPLRDKVRSLGVLLDPELSLEAQVTAVARSAFLQLRLIHQLRPYLENDCLATVTHALVTSRLDFCNALYVGLPLKTVRILQLVQNRAARLLTGTGRYVHMTPVLRQLHWLPIEVRAQFKVLVMTYKALNGLGPGYLKERLHPYMPSRPLRSAGEALLREPSMEEVRRVYSWMLNILEECLQEKEDKTRSINMGQGPGGIRRLMGLALLMFLQGMMDSKLSDATKVCGKQGFMNRIVGGENSQDGEWPWQVSIKMNGKHHCGGSLIGDQWLITASHCFKQFCTPSNFTVLLGALKLSDPGPHSITVDVKKIILNPTYDGDVRSGDIALVQLEQPVKFSHQIIPICVPDANVTFAPGHKCWVTGWGDVQARDRYHTSNVLKKLEVPIISTNTCNALYRQNSGHPKDRRDIKKDMICAGFAAGRGDACQGDSGGPLACQVKDTWLLAGVVSWGDGCAQKNRPGVYARVTSYQTWIHSMIPELAFTSTNTKSHGPTVNNKSTINSTSTGHFSLLSIFIAGAILLLFSE
ncbi:Serine protease 27 [Varanus komodoensis]|nr:Serine protease 27 [Varanus komodoensis]